MRHHIIISGTGRSGTTLLVQLLSHMGLPTGAFEGKLSGISPVSHAGLEYDIRKDDAPYIVKSPVMCAYLPKALAADVVIDYAIVPIRSLTAAAESRRDVVRRHAWQGDPMALPGGLFGTREPRDQEAKLAELLYGLLHTLALHEIPVVLVEFPRLVRDPDYLFRCLRKAIPIERGAFDEAFSAVVRPELVHDFGLGIIE